MKWKNKQLRKYRYLQRNRCKYISMAEEMRRNFCKIFFSSETRKNKIKKGCQRETFRKTTGAI